MEGTYNVRPSVCFEVQKITAVCIGEGNQRNYQVQWAPTWISSVHLVGCEHLIEEFSQQSEKGQVVDDDNHVNIDTDTAAKEGNVKADYEFQRDMEGINGEELVVVEPDLTDPSVLNKDVRSKHKALNKPSKKYECNICQQVFKNSQTLSQHSHTIHKTKWECELCGRKCKSETALLLHKHKHKRKQCPAQHMIPIHDLLTDLRENMSGDTGVLAFPRRQVTHKINTQACTVVNNNHSSEFSNTSIGNGDQTISSMDTGMSNSHCQITDMYGGNQTNCNLGHVEKSINSIDFNRSDISTNVGDNMHVEVDKFANVYDEGDDRLLLGSQRLTSMLHLNTEDIESDRVFRNVVEVKMDETVVVKSNLADPNICSKDTTKKCKSLKKSSKRKKSNVCHKMENENNDKLSQHSGKVHMGKWECDFCDMKCRNKTALLFHRREHKRQNRIQHSAHKCSYCGKIFNRRYKLVEHARVHTNERPFDCKFCEQSFKRNDHLKRHTFRKHK